MRLASILMAAAGLTYLATATPAGADATSSRVPASAPTRVASRNLADTVPPNPLPPPVTTEHVLNLPGRTLHFKATAGAIRLSDAESGKPIADIAYTAYQLDGADPAKRPLTVAVNGGPGASSAWLDLGAIGPWRLPIDPHNISPSMPTQVVDNADTWLDFTDLVFVDPLGTGYSRIVGKDEGAEKHLYAVNGDIDELSTVVRKWLVANGRLGSPKFIVGESYGGFRAPKLARHLEDKDGIGIGGLVMISPVLDFAWFMSDSNPAIYAGHLPSLVAAAKGITGANPRDKLRAAESYASGPYLIDLYRGLRDANAIRRMSLTIAGFTGMDQKFVQRLGGRVDATTLMREKNRDAGLIASSYDTKVKGYDPNPFDWSSHYEDPILDGLKVPMATAMADVTANKLGWPINARYEILNMAVNGHWDWDAGRHPAEAMGDLSALLSLDKHFRAIVMHGVTDQVTPYFTSKLLIDQIPDYGDPGRIKLNVYDGGHMPYLESDARAAMHEDARKLIQGEPKQAEATPAEPTRAEPKRVEPNQTEPATGQR